MSKEMTYSPKQHNVICISRSQQISSFLFEWKTPKSDLCFGRRVLNETPEGPAGSSGESKGLFALFGATALNVPSAAVVNVLGLLLQV